MLKHLILKKRLTASLVPQACTLISCRSISDIPSFDYQPQDMIDIAIARGRGLDVLHDPVTNKGTGHPLVERERLGLRGLLPTRVLSMDEQLQRCLDRYHYGHDWLTSAEENEAGITHEHLRKWKELQEMQDRNETLFYRLLVDNFEEMDPSSTLLWLATSAATIINFIAVLEA